MATAESRAHARQDLVPDDPPREKHAELMQKEKQIRKEEDIAEHILGVKLSEKGNFGLYAISVAKKDKEGSNVRDTSIPPRFMYLPLTSKATVEEVLAWFEKLYPGRGERRMVERALGQELVSVRAKTRNKTGGGGRRGRYAA